MCPSHTAEDGKTVPPASVMVVGAESRWSQNEDRSHRCITLPLSIRDLLFVSSNCTTGFGCSCTVCGFAGVACCLALAGCCCGAGAFCGGCAGAAARFALFGR